MRLRGEGVGILLKRSVLNANHRAYRCRSSLIGFFRPMEFALYRPTLFSGVTCLGLDYVLLDGVPGAWHVENTDCS